MTFQTWLQYPESVMLITFIFTCLFAGQLACETHVYKQIGNRELKLFVIIPVSLKPLDQKPAIVFFHGGGWVDGGPEQFAEQSKYLASRGMVAVQVEYRLLDRDSTDPPAVCVQDAKSAMRWVRGHAEEFGIDPCRIASAGGSAGGHLAAFTGMVDGNDSPNDDLSVSAKPNAMVLFNPVFDNGPNGWGHERVADRYVDFSPYHHVSENTPPAIVFLGTEDTLIPIETVNSFQAEMRNRGVRCDVMLFEGMPHGFFNYGNYENIPYIKTIVATDRFLASLGWLEGAPTLDEPRWPNDESS